MVALLDRLLSALAPPFCWACGGPGAPGGLCPGCRSRLRRLTGVRTLADGATEVWAPLAYEGPATALARALKYRGAVGLAGPMAAQIAANAPTGWLGSDATVVPVPLHPRRRRRRGYNQAALLAAELALRRGLTVAELLRRYDATGRQVGRDREQRLGAMRRVIGPAPGAVGPARVLLVDDVVTTGATLMACAAALRELGVADIRAVAFALTPGR